MKFVGKKLMRETGEPAMRSCSNCNAAHEHLLKEKCEHWCYDCGRHYGYGRFFDTFKNEKEFLEWARKVI
jgi:hypothetical protein